MDAVAGLLDGPRAREAFLLRSTLSPPWAIRVQDEAPLTLVAVVRGSAVLLPDAGAARSLARGDVVIVRGPGPYVLADAPGTPPDVVISPGQVCTTPEGREITAMAPTGVRSWGNDPAGDTVLLTGTYQLSREVSRRLLVALPPVVVLESGSWQNPLVDYLADEVGQDGPGQQALLDRLLDVLRAWFARADARAPGWYHAHTDPVVGPALRLLHARPAEPWTVASLAAETGLSRAALARRFTTLVGEPPMTYLTHWRLALAADLLAEPGATVHAVAGQVGYGSSFALSTAFRRVYGHSPRAHRG